MNEELKMRCFEEATRINENRTDEMSVVEKEQAVKRHMRILFQEVGSFSSNTLN